MTTNFLLKNPSIFKTFIENLFDKPSIAEKARYLLITIFKYAIDYFDLTNVSTIPLILFSRSLKLKKVFRTRVLTVEEIKLIFQDINSRPNFITTLMLKALFITGCRKLEIQQIKWNEIDLENNIWHLPEERSKTKKSIDIPINAEFKNILLKAKELNKNKLDFVFNPNSKNKKAIFATNYLNKFFDKLIKKLNIEDVVIHDIRRTVRTLLSQLNISTNVADKYLNHSINKSFIQRVYDQSNLNYFEERLEAMNILCKFYKDINCVL